MKSENDKSDNMFKSVKLKVSNKYDSTHDQLDDKLDDGLNSNVITYDKRVQLTKIFVSIMLLVTVIGTFTTDNALNESFILSVVFVLLAANNYIGFYVLRNDIAMSLIFALFCVYVWIAFPLKLILAVNDPMTLWVSHSFFDPETVRKEIAGSFLSLMPGLFFFFLGLYYLGINIKRRRQFTAVKINHMIFIVVIVALMALRLFNQVVLDIGVPGVIPKSLPIPYAVGILELLSRPVLMALVNLYFFYVIRLNDNKAMWLALIFLLSNIVLGLRVGYKSELVIQGLLLVYYVFESSKYMSKANLKFIKLFTIFMLVAMVVLYPLVNNYRSYLLSGKDFSEAVESAKIRTEKQQSSFALSFLNRINGIGAFYAATKLGEGGNYNINSLFNNEIMDLIKEKLYGAEKDKAVTAFGTTQFSVLYLIGGGLFLAVFSFMFGWFIRWSSSVLRLRIFKSDFTFQAYLPLLCILWVKLLSSGGNVSLYVKELVLVITCLYLLERYGTQINNDK